MIQKLLRSRALAFLVLGAIFYATSQVLFPEPKPVIGPLAESRVQALVDEWQGLMGRTMNESELKGLLVAELDRDMLFAKALELELHLIDPVIAQRLLRNVEFLGLYAEQSDAEKIQSALAMRMHLGDEVVKRRLIQLAEEWLLLSAPPKPLSDQDLLDYYQANQDQFWSPERYTFSHVFFPREREAEMHRLAAKLGTQIHEFDEALTYGAPFLPGYHFTRQTAEQLARQFGAGFVSHFLALPPAVGQWQTPIASTFGWHLVWLQEEEGGRTLSFDEARNDIVATLQRERRTQALDDAKAALRQDYEIIL